MVVCKQTFIVHLSAFGWAEQEKSKILKEYKTKKEITDRIVKNLQKDSEELKGQVNYLKISNEFNRAEK